MTNHKLQTVPILKMDCSFPIDTSGRPIIILPVVNFGDPGYRDKMYSKDVFHVIGLKLWNYDWVFR